MIALLIATGGLVFAFGHATIAGKLVLLLLAVGSIFSWSVMLTKLRVVQFAGKQNARFLHAFRQDRQPLRLLEKNARFPGSPLFNVYRAGCQEVTFQLLGSAEVDETFKARLGIADKIAPAQMGSVIAAMAPGVSGALITTVTALCVAIPAMFGYNFLVTRIRGMIVEMDNFAAELASELEHKFVDHGARESAFRR